MLQEKERQLVEAVQGFAETENDPKEFASTVYTQDYQGGLDGRRQQEEETCQLNWRREVCLRVQLLSRGLCGSHGYRHRHRWVVAPFPIEPGRHICDGNEKRRGTWFCSRCQSVRIFRTPAYCSAKHEAETSVAFDLRFTAWVRRRPRPAQSASSGWLRGDGSEGVLVHDGRSRTGETKGTRVPRIAALEHVAAGSIHGLGPLF